jgi:GPN-loop GTPase
MVNSHPRHYLPELQRAREARERSLQAVKEDSMNRLMKDLAVDRARFPEAAARDRWEQEDDDEDDDTEINIIDKSGWTLRHKLPVSVPSSSILICLSWMCFLTYLILIVFSLLGDDSWPGQYIDLTRVQRSDENVTWPRPI